MTPCADLDAKPVYTCEPDFYLCSELFKIATACRVKQAELARCIESYNARL